MIKLIIFDLDGTILDNEIFTIESKIIEGKKIGYDISKEVAIKSLGMSYDNSKKYFQSIYGVSFPYDFFRNKRFEYIFNYVKEHGLPLKKGAKEILDFCKSHNIKTALCTSSTCKYLDEYKKYSNYFDNFDLIITGDKISKGKPDPEIFLKAINFFKLDPSEVCIVEDSINGIKGALNSSANAIMIPDLIEPTEEIKNLGVIILPSLLDLVEYIKDL